MYHLAIWVVLTFPFVGLTFIYIAPDDYDWLTQSNQNSAAPLIYYSIFLIGAIIATLSFRKRDFRVFSNSAVKSYRTEYLLLITLAIILLIVFVIFGGLNVLIGELSKEDIRQSNFILSILTKYLVPSIFAFFCALRRTNLVTRSSWQLSFVMTFIIGMSGGGKASVLITLLPGLAILYGDRLSILKALMIALITFALLVGTAWLFDSFLDRDLIAIIKYLTHRAFVLTAEAPYQVSLAYFQNQEIIQYRYTLFEVVGKSILSYFIPQQEMHKYLFSHAITAWLYPDNVDAIISGAWNITPNVFVEALVLGGLFALPIFGWAVVYGAYFLWGKVIQKVNRHEFASASVLSVYAVLVFLSWINSAGITQLVHPLALGSLALSWICLKTISRYRRRISLSHSHNTLTNEMRNRPKLTSS